MRSYDVLRRGQAVAIVLYDPDHDSVVLIEQFRLPALLAGSSPWQIEAAAGMIDSDETPEAVAIRETREETGLSLIGDPIMIQRYLPSAGGSDESVVLFCGRVNSTLAAGVHGLAEEHEDIRVVVKSLSEVEALLDAGAIESGHTLVALSGFSATAAACAGCGEPGRSSAPNRLGSHPGVPVRFLPSRFAVSRPCACSGQSRETPQAPVRRREPAPRSADPQGG